MFKTEESLGFFGLCAASIDTVCLFDFDFNFCRINDELLLCLGFANLCVEK